MKYMYGHRGVGVAVNFRRNSGLPMMYTCKPSME
jgi:hypothetical protein